MNARSARILFVFGEELGWRTYSAQFRKVLAGRDDFQWEVLSLPRSRWRKVVLKRHNMGRMDRVFRHVDPIIAYRGPLGRPVRAAVDHFRPDLVHFAGHLPAASLLGTAGAPAFTVALDATRANMNRFRASPVWSRGELEREATLLRGARRLFPWSRWAGDSTVADHGVAPERVSVVFPSIEPEMVGVRRPETRSGPPRVLFIGNHFRRKGGDLLHRWATGPLAGLCELHIVSADPLVKDLHGQKVVVHGAVPHRRLMTELLPSMDLLCHPTQRDMSAYVVVEAAFAGLPAVASNVGGIPELILDGETGWSLDRGDEAGFIRTLRMLFENPGRVAEAGLRARRHAEASFDGGKNYNAVIDMQKAQANASR